MKAYLDIDGVILANDQQKANYSEEFIKYIVEHYDVYWLTTHCKGDAEHTINHLSRFFSPETIELLRKIKPTNWDTWKTDAIDLDEDFLWFDDQVFEMEINSLKEKGKFDSWVQIDLSKDNNQLKSLIVSLGQPQGKSNIVHDNIKWRKKYKDFTEYEYNLPIKIHSNDSGHIIINYPGAEGDIDGYNKKYETLANHIQDSGLAAVVRSGNPFVPVHGWTHNLRELINYCLENPKKICGSNKPDLWLMGFSAGAGAIGLIAWEYPEVSKILLAAPAKGVGEEKLVEGLNKFTGAAYILVGDHDEVVSIDDCKQMYEALDHAKHRKLIVIPNCDHQFRGEENGRILSQAPFYAFDSGTMPKFPDPKAGIKLY